MTVRPVLLGLGLWLALGGAGLSQTSPPDRGMIDILREDGILVPFAAATNNHQELNARVVESAGGAIVITEKDLTPERLGLAVSEIANDAARMRRMGDASRQLARPEATRNIVEYMERIQTK